jgi:hypothetical protein
LSNEKAAEMTRFSSVATSFQKLMQTSALSYSPSLIKKHNANVLRYIGDDKNRGLISSDIYTSLTFIILRLSTCKSTDARKISQLATIRKIKIQGVESISNASVSNSYSICPYMYFHLYLDDVVGNHGNRKERKGPLHNLDRSSP